MPIEPSESSFQGKWVLLQGKMAKDEVCQRIEDLVKNYLKQVKSDESGWNVLYQDTSDGRYWELSYPESEIHGGGPPKLAVLPVVEAKKRYGLVEDGSEQDSKVGQP